MCLIFITMMAYGNILTTKIPNLQYTHVPLVLTVALFLVDCLVMVFCIISCFVQESVPWIPVQCNNYTVCMHWCCVIDNYQSYCIYMYHLNIQHRPSQENCFFEVQIRKLRVSR